MEVENHSNGENQTSGPDLGNPNNGSTFDPHENQRFSEEIDSSCSTPYVSAPSSPGRGPSGYYYSAPASPMHFVLSSSAGSAFTSSSDLSVSGSVEFEFSARLSSSSSVAAGSMISADELFLNGQIRPMKLSSHLQRPQMLAPLLDLEVEDEDEENKDSRELDFEKREEQLMRGRDLRLRNRSLHRRARSMSPLRNAEYQWHEEEEEEDHEERESNQRGLDLEDHEVKQIETPSTGTTPSVSASSSRSSSSGRSSKRWVFLKDFLYRSKSEGRGNAKEKFWSSISFSPAKEKKHTAPFLPFSSPKEKKTPPSEDTQKPKRPQHVPAKKNVAGKPANGVGKRRIPPSPHELHYTANRAQAEEMKKKTFLPYKQGLLGCLGFSSKGYGAMNGFARTLNPVSSR
ncbi:hypothetical protein HHK36_020848 [Tetracentron sinense]|uniref:Stress response NST1-like protein n=1 Tax=Tetracentron sinense TaxID=13715 RepID=A0A834YSF7_TETSI|nr:hypothetical protein HHK36_020848 [Tetracentron sinense]